MTAGQPVAARIHSASPCPHPWPVAVCPVCAPYRADAGGGAEPGPESTEAAGQTGRPTSQASAEAVHTAVLAALADGATDLEFRDGELLLRAEALDLLGAARRAGARSLTVWTTGALLGRPGTAQAVRKAGATHVAVTLMGDTDGAHDYVTGTPGHFARVRAGLQASRKAGLGVLILAPLLRPTFRGLPALVQKILPIGVAGVRMWAPPGPDRAQHPLLAPLAVMAPTIRSAAHLLTTAKRTWQIEGVPACLLGEFARRDPAPLRYDARREGGKEPAGMGELGPACDRCTWQPHCAGQAVDRARLHGWIGLEPRTDPPGQGRDK